MIPAVEVIQPIKAGEQLYVSYYGERDQAFKDHVRSLPSGPVACTWVRGGTRTSKTGACPATRFQQLRKSIVDGSFRAAWGCCRGRAQGGPR